MQHNAQFQFTPLREGRPTGRESPFRRSHFNSRPSARGDQRRRRQWKPLRQFQFTPLREGRQAFKSNREGNNIFQFTPLREGRRRRHDLRGRRDLISIHAPPRGATLAGGREKRRFIISIHAPPRGATRKKWYLKLTDDFNSRPSARGDEKQRRTRAATTTHFNSRPSARGDRKGLQPRRHKRISIHAPPRGATPAPSADQHHQLFQFTPLREGRRCDYAIYGRRVNFNSRPSARGDP